MPGNKRKAYVVIMLVGAGALFVDRCIMQPGLTAPAPVSAAVSTRAGETTVIPAPTAEALATLELPFPRTMPKWDAQSPIRDIFAPGSHETATDKQPRSRRSAEKGLGTCADILAHHRLEAVLVQNSLKIAIVNGALLREGASVGGCTLTEITGNKVRFRCRDGEAALALSPRQ